MDGKLAIGGAVFSSETSSHQRGVLIRFVIVLPNGGEGYLTADLRLDGPGAVWTYYEKVSVGSVSFDPTQITGTIVILDRYETQSQASLKVGFRVHATSGSTVRTLADGVLVTAPSPTILRSSGHLPAGVVVVDDGSGTYLPSTAYERGEIGCTGSEGGVVVLSDDAPYGDELVYDDPGTPPVYTSDPPDYEYDPTVDDSPPDDPGCSSKTKDDSSDGGSDSSRSSSSGCGSRSDDSDSKDSDTDSSSDESTTDDSKSNGCFGSAHAASRLPIGQQVCAVTGWYGPRRPPLLARRLVRLSPLLLLLLGIWLGRERAVRRRATR